MTKVILTRILFLLILTSGGYYIYHNRQKPQVPETSNTQSAQSTLPQTVDDLVKKSVTEEINSQSRKSPESSNNNSAINEPLKEICLSQQTFGCYEDYYKILVADKGVAAAFTDLKARYAGNGYIKSQCHPITHVIGNWAVELYPDVGQAYIEGDSFCWSGYYHGVMEGIIGKISRPALPAKMDGICDTIPGKLAYSFDYYNCVHGLGHGVMAITQDELFESLTLCDNLVGGWEQSSCHGGVFMENIIIDNKNHFTKYLKPEEALYPCTAVEDRYKGTCYLMQTSYMLKVTNSDFSKVFDLCSQVGNFAATCYQSLGRDASGRSISNVEATKSSCSLGKDYDQKSNCIVGAVKDFVSYHHSDVQAKQLCAALETDLQSTCFSTVESYYKSFN